MLRFEFAEKVAAAIVGKHGQLIIVIDRPGGAVAVHTAFVFIQLLAQTPGGVTVENDFIGIPQRKHTRFLGDNLDIEIIEIIFGIINRHGRKITTNTIRGNYKPKVKPLRCETPSDPRHIGQK